MLSVFQEKKLLEILHEDTSKKDISSALLEPMPAKATIKCNQDCILSGLEETTFLFSIRHTKTKSFPNTKTVPFSKDGQPIKKGQKIMQIIGSNRQLLETERTALNILGRMSGVATLCKKASTIAGKKTKIFLTRKTMPGFNEFDKKACLAGNVFPHRKNLNEMILIKNNHLAFDSIQNLLAKAQKQKNKTIAKKTEIEVQNMRQAVLAAKNNADIIMLDNFSPKKAKVAIKKIHDINKKTLIELSGGINLKNLKQYTSIGADIISVGELTKKAHMVDFSMSMQKNNF